ncbi:MAG: acetate--CoA ligase [Flavobacteriaceae bacterium]
MNRFEIKNIKDYTLAYSESVDNPEKFWEKIASNNFKWKRKWDSVLTYDFSIPKIEWFSGAELNITENCIDRHLSDKGEKTAILFEPNDPNLPAEHITYNQLYKRVNRFANVLKSNGITKGDRVCIYLPMIPDLPISLLACARIGAIHSVVFAGFSSSALTSRINDCNCKMVITSDGSNRGDKKIILKDIVDKALESCPTVETVLVAKCTNLEITMVANRDKWLKPLLDKASEKIDSVAMKAEDPLFILYTSGSTGKPKGMVHTTAGYMVYTSYTFKNIFQYKSNDIYWCTADIGWITGHSYIVYGPLLNGATTVMFEGVPSFPNYSRFWKIIEKHKINQFYTAPTAIRALAKQGNEFIKPHDLSSLKVIGTVGEPINEEAWNWYNEVVGNSKCPIVDTWWQTETGGILISPIPNSFSGKPAYATLPFIGIQPALMDSNGKEINKLKAEGRLAIKFPWPSIARTIWGNHKRYKETYFSTFDGFYFSGDGAQREKNGHYRITGRVDDVIIVSGHNLGTAPIEEAINEHEKISESAVVGFSHPIKGNALYGFITLKSFDNQIDYISLKDKINKIISEQIGPIAKLDKIQFTDGLPKTRSGKIMRRILRKIANNDISDLGDTSTLLNPEVVEEIILKSKNH